MPLEPLASAPFEFRSINRGSSMRLLLEGAEVWQGLTFRGIVSADVLDRLLRERMEYLLTTDLLRTDLQADPRRPLGPPAAALPEPSTRKPLAFVPIDATLRARRRQARRKRRRR